jgi:hypothetical protein
MQGMNGRVVPRRWSVESDGIRWLPRLTDKAKMYANGSLGAYLFGHSPVDKALLRRLGLTTAEFGELARECGSDQDVLAALHARGFDETRVRRWSDRFPKTYRLLIRIWDIDDGYIAPSAFDRVWLGAFRVVEGGVMRAFRRISPAP